MDKVFDPKVIGSIERLDLRARRLVEGFMIGIHRSPFRGISTDFAEHRMYAQGDDLKHLDWRVFARSDRFYVKRYEQETNMEVRFVMDCSKSMFYRSPDAPMSKFEYAATLVASLAYLVFKQNDAFGLSLFDGDLRLTLPPRSTFAHFKQITNSLESATPGADTGLGNALKKIGMLIKRRGMVVIVSDFLDDLDVFAEGLSLHGYRGNDVMLFRIEDPWEAEFPYRGRTTFLGMEGEGKLICDPLDLRNLYAAGREKHITALYDICRKQAFFMEHFLTNKPLEATLSAFLNARAGMRTSKG